MGGIKKYNAEDYVGQKFGKLTVLKSIGLYKKNTAVLCRCECGVEKPVALIYLLKGETKSCGCGNWGGQPVSKSTHGLSDHPLYEIWLHIKRRCYCKTDKGYRFYGACGVTICEEWLNDFKTFYDWSLENGWRKGLQLDKDLKAPNKSGKMYCPEYCSYLSPTENGQYKKNTIYLEYNGETKTIMQWCRQLNIKMHMVRHRIFNLGWPIEKSFFQPSRIKNERKKINK